MYMIFFIVLYLLVICVVCALYAIAALLGQVPKFYEPIRVVVACCAAGGIGGALYCLRAVYLNRCARNSWTGDWNWWYFIRPVTSIICGGVSYVFLRAGLLVLESKTQGAASEIGFYALAFIAGLNVDKFVQKIEGVAQAVWGIEKSRSATSGNLAQPTQSNTTNP